MRTKMAIRLCLVAAAVISMNAAAKGETARSTMAPGATLGKGYEISLPDKKWSLVIDLPGFVIFTEEYVPDRQMKKMMAIKGEIHVTIYMEKKPRIRNIQEFRNQFLSELQEAAKLMSPDMVFTDFRTSETDQMAVLEYSTKNHIMEIKFIIGFMVRDSIGIRISVSKRNFKAGEEKQLWEILNSVRFKEK